MKKLFLFLFVVLIPHLAHAKINIVTTTTDLGAISRAVGGDLVEVKNLCRGDQDPHFLEPKPSFAVALNQADLLIQVGLDLESGWLPVLLTQSRNPKIQRGTLGWLDASVGIPVMEIPTETIDRSMGDVHPLGNPHYWLNPQNGILIAQAISERLSKIDPTHASQYENNRTQFSNRLREKIKEWEQTAASLKGKKIITHHKSFSYLAGWLGLDTIAYLEPKPGIPPSPGHILDLMGIIKNNSISLIAVENYYDPQAGVELGKKTGTPVRILPTATAGDKKAPDYFSLFDFLISQLKEPL